MNKENTSVEFDINEVLHFETGQEIEEMLAISLDPDIAIQTYDDYIEIRGIILLNGEYIRATNVPNVSGSRNEHASTKFIEKVAEMDAGRSTFSHRFPVEVSVPSNLVTNLEDITVSVDAFDYELPDQNKLNIHASIHIHGIHHESSKEEVVEESGKNRNEHENILDITEKEDEGVLERMRAEEKTERDIKENISEVVDSRHEQTELDQPKKTAEQTLELVETKEDTAVTEPNLIDRQEVTLDEAQVDEKQVNVEEATEIDIQLNEHDRDEENDDINDVQFLTDLFGGEEAASTTKMRIYIIQEEDSIESIAKKYEVSSLQIMKDNNISGESLEAGELLYLPVLLED